MHILILGLVVLTGALLGALLYQQVITESSMGPAALVGAAVLGIAFLAMLTTLLLYRTRYRTLVANLWLAVFSVSVSYFALDLAAGWILIRPLSPPLVPDAVRHHRLVPDSFAEFQQRDFSYVQRVNTHGLRGKEFSTEKAPGSYRIIMLGDSFTMGKGVEDDQTFSAVLEKDLRTEQSTCGTPVEVLNAGVDSYAPILGLLYLKGELLPLKPDLVIYNLDVSDLVQETAYRKQGVHDANGQVVAVPQLAEPDSLMETFRIWTEHHLFFTRVALLYANRLLGYRELTVRDVLMRADVEVVAHTLEGDVDRTEQWRAIFDSLTRMKQFCDVHGIAFMLSVYPWAHQISATEWLPGRFAFMPKNAVASGNSLARIHELATLTGIELVDMFPMFRAYQGGRALYFPYDMHWTPAGHEVAARALAEQLSKRHTWCQ